MSKTKKQTSTTTPADPAVVSAYNSIIPQAQKLASQPLQLYQGNLVAPLSAAQNQGIAGIQAAQGVASPYYAQAQKYFNTSANPITPTQYSPSAVNQYMNPYVSDVVNQTQQAFNLANQEQQANLTGNTAFNGGLTNDRSAVMQAELAKQQAAAQDPILAQLYQSGFNTAQGEFNTQQGVGLQAAQANAANAANAGFGVGALGTSAANTGINAANALINAGGLQQQVAQEQLNVPYEQYLQQQAYPYQSLDFLSSILGQAAQGTGTSQVSKTSQPFLGLAAGGRSRLGLGGAPVPSTVPDLSQGYIPLTANSGARGLIAPSTYGMGGANDNQDPLLKAASDIQAGRTLYNTFDPFGGASTGQGFGVPPLMSSADSGGFFDSIGSGISDAVDGALAFFGMNKGGRTKLADGGFDDADYPDPYDLANDDLGGGGYDTTTPPGANIMAPPPGMADAAPVPLSNAPTYADGTSVVSPGPADKTQPAGFAGAARVPGDLTPAQFTPKDPSIWQSVFAGLGSMIAHNNIGAGIMGGLEDYEKQEDLDRHPRVDHTGSTIRVFYPAEKQWVDTGIPTEAALGREQTGAYRTADLAQRGAIAQLNAEYQAGRLNLAQYDAKLKAVGLMLQQNPFAQVTIPELPGPEQGTGAPGTGIGATNRANNNFGNLRTPDGKGWQKFDSPQEGIDAVTHQLSLYGTRDKLNTVSGIVSKYAPPTENDTPGYIKDVSTQLGVDPNAPLNMNDPSVLKSLTNAIIKHEQGGAGADASAPTATSATFTPAPGGIPVTATTSAAGGQLPVPVPSSVAPEQSPDGAHGAAFLSTLPPAAATQVKALAEGRMQFPSGFALRSPYWQRMLMAVAQYDPQFDAVNYNARAATRRDFSSLNGKGGQQLTAFNTAIQHAGRLDQHIDDLNNTWSPDFNNLANWASIHAVNDPHFQTALSNFNTDKQALTDELTRAFRLSSGNVSDIQNWEQKLDAAASPVTLHSAVQEAIRLLQGRIEAVGDTYNRGMGTTADPVRLLSPKAQATIQRIEGGDQTGAAPNAPANANAPNIPARPATVPSGSQYSPSRNMWRDPAGNLYNAQGQRAA